MTATRNFTPSPVTGQSQPFADLLTDIFGDHLGYVHVTRARIADVDSDKRAFRVRGYQWPNELPALRRVIERWITEGFDVYFTPVLFDSPTDHGIESVTLAPVVHADLDTCPREKVSPSPSYWWETSKGSFQALWALDGPGAPSGPYSVTDVEEAARGIYMAHRDFGVDACWSIPRWLRVPLSVNHKPGRDLFTVTEPQGTGFWYALSEFPDPADLPTTYRTHVGASEDPVGDFLRENPAAELYVDYTRAVRILEDDFLIEDGGIYRVARSYFDSPDHRDRSSALHRLVCVMWENSDPNGREHLDVENRVQKILQVMLHAQCARSKWSEKPDRIITDVGRILRRKVASDLTRIDRKSQQ